MKTLVISDMHLTPQFEERKFLFLNKLFRSYDKIIINGDLWDGYLSSFEAFYASRWNKLFTTLQKARAIYIIGNHDARELGNTEKLHPIFEEITDQFTLTDQGKTFHIEHGHRLLPLNPEVVDVSNPSFQRGVNIMNTIERSLISVLGDKYRYVSRSFNNNIRNKARKRYSNFDMFICGHTHSQELSLKHGFANSGVVKFGLGQYLSIENGEITAHSERY
ncbi:metallophosphoesterase [Candidatus Woesebacteria bacterium]|nr:metallophosphoesterase [Candidatus Woesebacteria bacterium]